MLFRALILNLFTRYIQTGSAGGSLCIHTGGYFVMCIFVRFLLVPCTYHTTPLYSTLVPYHVSLKLGIQLRFRGRHESSRPPR
jgi:hypothetical protein